MARKPRPWFRADRNAWFVTIDDKRINLGTDEAAALEEFRRLTGLTEAKPSTLDALARDFLDYYRSTRAPNSYGVARSRLTRFRAAFGHLEPDKLTPGLLEQWASKQSWSPSATRGVLTVVSSLMNWAVRERLIERNPIGGIQKPSMGRRSLLLSDDQVRRLLQAAKPDLRMILELLEHTGARPHVLCDLDARSIDWGRGFAVGTSKNRPYLVYLSEEWLGRLRELAECHPMGPLLRTLHGKPWTPQRLSQRLKRLGDRLGFRAYPYAFRHRFATRKLAEGVAPAVVAALLNHTDLTMISRHYGHVGAMHDLLRESI